MNCFANQIKKATPKTYKLKILEPKWRRQIGSYTKQKDKITESNKLESYNSPKTKIPHLKISLNQPRKISIISKKYNQLSQKKLSKVTQSLKSLRSLNVC